MIDRLFKRHYLKIVNDYSEKLASGIIIDPGEAESCHWAKLVLYSEKELRVVSLKTISDSNYEAAIPHILREINLLTQRGLNERTSQLILILYSILCSKNTLPIE